MSPDPATAATATDPQLAPAPKLPTAAEVSREAAVRALTLALEHRYPAADEDDLAVTAARAVDIFLTLGQLPWTILVQHGTHDQHRFAEAVLRTDPTYDRSGPTPRDLAAASTAIHTLIHDLL